MRNEFGKIDTKGFDVSRYGTCLTLLKNSGIPIYSAAYILPSGKKEFGSPKKHINHLRLIGRLLDEKLESKILDCESLEGIFATLRAYPTIGSFLAYQYAIDINYSEIVDFSEMDFVKAGPGAQRGIRKCFRMSSQDTYESIVREVASRHQSDCESLGLNFRTLWGRPLQLIDIQNLFCEIDKYTRGIGLGTVCDSTRSRPKQLYKLNPDPVTCWFPPKWKLAVDVSHS